MPIRWRCEKGYHKEKLHDNDVAHADDYINGKRRRASLETQSEREANRKYIDLLKEWRGSSAPTADSKKFRRMTVADAVEAYVEERMADVSAEQVKSWRVSGRALAAYFKDTRLCQITADMVVAFKNRRLTSDLQHGLGKVKPKSVNNELGALRQILKRAEEWNRLATNFHLAKVTVQRQGRALSDAEQVRLFTVAQSQTKYRWVYCMLVLGYYCGMRPCECLGLQWKDIDFERRILSIRKSKTPAGWRDPSLNSVCFEALMLLYEQARGFGMAEPNHYVFPYHQRGRWKNAPLDPTKPMVRYARQWAEIKKAAGLEGVWFYDGRHTARTKMAEMGMPDEVMDAQMGHVSPAIGKRYSHIRREAMKRAAAALEPAEAVRQILINTPEADKNATIQ